jgi:tRNA(Ile)-lysidine synthase TilS/MesJ
MQELQNISQLKNIKKSDLPTRVSEEIFPIFETLITPEIEIAVGVSSGVDSMTVACLLLLRYEENHWDWKNIHIVHCNHKLRKQSEIEEQFMQDFFEGIPLHIYHRTDDI